MKRKSRLRKRVVYTLEADPRIPPADCPPPEIVEEPEPVLNYVENAQRLPLPDTIALQLAPSMIAYFFPFTFEDLPYYETEFKSADDLERAKRFLKQVRQTCGYDIDCLAPRPLWTPLFPVADLEQLRMNHPRLFQNEYIQPVLLAIDQINEKEGLNLEFVGLVKVVNTAYNSKFLTFTVRPYTSAPIETLQALMTAITLYEWRGLDRKPLLQVSPPD